MECANMAATRRSICYTIATLEFDQGENQRKHRNHYTTLTTNYNTRNREMLLLVTKSKSNLGGGSRGLSHKKFETIFVCYRT